LSEIVIINYGLGNLKSVQHAFAQHHIKAVISSAAGAIEEAAGLVLPGVGAFGRAMDNLDQLGLTSLLKKKVGQGTPFLGICLGLQLLFEGSEEAPSRRGLSLLPGRVVRFQGDFKIPLIGWNQLEMRRNDPLLEGIGDHPYFYFVHSYYALPQNPAHVLAYSCYGNRFPAVVGRQNCYGLQFHPEKSSREGLKIIGNFGRLVKSCASNSGH
jgi:imidazole glycerol-phosphate synthase subunit HisH